MSYFILFSQSRKRTSGRKKNNNREILNLKARNEAVEYQKGAITKEALNEHGQQSRSSNKDINITKVITKTTVSAEEKEQQ